MRESKVCACTRTRVCARLCVWGVAVQPSLCKWGGRGRSFPKVQQNGWFGNEKQCQGAVLNFNCLHLDKEKEVSSENEATLQVKVGALACLSYFC